MPKSWTEVEEKIFFTMIFKFQVRYIDDFGAEHDREQIFLIPAQGIHCGHDVVHMINTFIKMLYVFF